ncbi:MAG: glycosyltransferase family 2 protein [Candidatus Micrarchaeaceae archaeon]
MYGEYIKVVILVLNHNGLEHKFKGRSILQTCLDELNKTEFENFKVIVLDDSTDGSKPLIAKYKLDMINLRGTFNISRATNQGIRYALKKYRPSYIIRMDNDVFVNDKTWLKKLIGEADKHVDLGIFGCKLIYPNNKIQHAGMELGLVPKNIGRGQADEGQYDEIKEVEGTTGGLFGIKTDIIKKVGLFDENFSGLEDVDYAVRVHKSGFKILYIGVVKALHIEGSTTTNSNDPNFKKRRFYQDQLCYIYYILKYYKSKILNAIIISILTAFISIENKNGKRSLVNMRIKDKPIRRLIITCSAIINAYKLYKKQTTR